MSIRMLPNAARLTVLGSGWSETDLESGDAFTEGGNIYEDIAGDLGYDLGDDLDWDYIAGDDADFDDFIYTDEEGNIFTDEDLWDMSEDEVSNLDTWIPEDHLVGISDRLAEVANNDSKFAQYNIEKSVLNKLFGGPTTIEGTVVTSGSDRPHAYYPPVFYIQRSSNNATLFLNTSFAHVDAEGDPISVSHEFLSVRPNDSRPVYWSDCTTHFWDNILPAEYQSYPISYICWQCMYGPFKDALLQTNEGTITTGMILKGNALYTTMTVNGVTYYKLHSVVIK